MLTVAVRIRQYADLVVTQARQIGGGGIDADGDTDVVDLLGLQHFTGIRFPGVQDLAAQRHDGLGHPVARLLGRAAGRIALDQEELAARRILADAVGQLAGQRRAGHDALAGDFLAVLETLLRIGDRQHGDLLALIRMLIEPEGEGVLDHSLNDSRRFARGQLFLGLSRELRLVHFHRQHEAHPVPDVLGRELQASRHQIAELAELAHRIRGS